MCGIAGLIKWCGDADPYEEIVDMTQSIVHRGPDGTNTWTENQVALGHNRLAILDLSDAASQPMFSVDKRYVITYNGEIYNFKELRVELQKEGYQFNTQSDTEVLLVAFVHWQTEAFVRLNGMFALAVWDRHLKKLTLARDRYGVKPLYYSQSGKSFLFASEKKAIVSGLGKKPGIDKQALVEYFTFQNFFTDRTLFSDIKCFPAGCYAEMDLNTTVPKLKVTRYWDFDFTEPVNCVSELEYKEELDRLFRQAINRQLVSDVEIGSYLSGGVDSGSITAVATSQLSDLKTFTLGFDLSSASGLELSFDERVKAEHLSYLLQTEHYEMVLKAGDMERCLPDLVRHLEEPRAGQSYPNFYASKLASRFVKVVLSGTGGDELFAGYPWRYYRAVANDNFENYVDNYYQFWQRLVPESAAKTLFKPIWQDVSNVSTREIFRDVLVQRNVEVSTPEEFLNLSLYFEAKTFLHGLLMVEDKLSMAHGLETRVPFLDNDLVDFATACPARLKLNNLGTVTRINENEPAKTNKYFQRTRDGKQLLRKVMANYVPEEVASRDKQGFSAPDNSWFKGESIEFVRRSVCNKNNPIYQFLDYKTVNNMVNEHLSGKQNRRLLVWSLLYFSEWVKQYNA